MRSLEKVNMHVRTRDSYNDEELMLDVSDEELGKKKRNDTNSSSLSWSGVFSSSGFIKAIVFPHCEFTPTAVTSIRPLPFKMRQPENKKGLASFLTCASGSPVRDDSSTRSSNKNKKKRKKERMRHRKRKSRRVI